MNKVILMGRITGDVEVQKSKKVSYANFSIAIRRTAEDTDFINCTVFGSTAEFMEKYVPKGTRIMLEGRLQNDKFEDKEGNTRYNMKVIVEQVEFADGKKEEETKPKYQKR